MKRRLLPLLAFPLFALLLLAVSDCSATDIDLQEPTAIIDPALLEALQHETEVAVLISLKEPDIPLAEWTTELRRQNAAERQARVLSVLTDEDFTLTGTFEISAALSGRITKSGVEKLASHPDVVAIGMTGLGTYSIIQPR